MHEERAWANESRLVVPDWFAWTGLESRNVSTGCPSLPIRQTPRPGHPPRAVSQAGPNEQIAPELGDLLIRAPNPAPNEQITDHRATLLVRTG
jgi:hypothetical protein